MAEGIKEILESKAFPNVLIVQEAARIMAAREDVNACVSYCFLDGRPQHKFHAEWQNFANAVDYGVIFAPIEHGKTEQLSVWRTIWELGRDPELRLCIMCGVKHMATKIVQQIEEIITLNEKVRRVFPNLVQEDRRGHRQEWNNSNFIVRRERNSKDPSCQAASVLGTIMGSRVDRMRCDDMNNFDNTFFEVQRERSIQWFKSSECMGRIAPGGKVIAINNPWHERALVHILEKELGFRAMHYRACDENLENILWKTEVASGRVVGFNRPRLEQKQRIMGPVEFSRCFLDSPLTDHTEWFAMQAMTKCVNENLKVMDPVPSDMVPICGVDPAVGKKTGNRREGEWCFFYGGVSPVTSRKRVRSISASRMTALEGLRELMRIHRLDPDCRFMVEDNAQQDYLVQILNTKELAAGVGATEADVIRLRGLVRPFTTGRGKHDPDCGIPSMAADFEAGTWEIPAGQNTNKWFMQAMAYRPGVHTGDVMMAAYLFWAECNRISTRRATVSESMSEFIRRKSNPNSRNEFSGVMTEVF